MRPAIVLPLVLGVGVTAALGGYWFAHHQLASPSAVSQTTAVNAPAQGQRKILYYKDPMGVPDTSQAPKKDSMGMDYIPVYADQAGDDGSIVKVSPARVQMLGVRTEPAAFRTLIRSVRAVGTVQFSERQQTVVSTKFEGWIEDLFVDTTGEPVRRGQPLMRVYSPLLVQTQQEYVDAAAMAASLAGAAVSLKPESHTGGQRSGS